MRMDVIAENMANINTTRTADGGPYRRKYVVFEERTANGVFPRLLSAAGYAGPRGASRFSGGGVRVAAIGEDQSEFKLDYNPSHPDAGEDGFVRMPNVEVVQEMTDMMSAYRAYEANITALNTFKDMAVRTLEIGS